MAKKNYTPEEMQAKMDKKSANCKLFFGTFTKALAVFLAVVIAWSLVAIAYTAPSMGGTVVAGTATNNGGSTNTDNNTGSTDAPITEDENLLGGDETTMLLLHPNFPQGLRSELIREGKSAHYLPNASMHQTITDDDAMAMVESGRGKSYVLRQTLECRGLSADTYRAVYRKWVSGVRGDELRDNRFLVASANLPADVRADMLERLSGIPMAGFILREHNRLSGRSNNLDNDIVEYIQVVDGWKRDISFFVRCDSLNGAGSLYEFVKTSKHYDSLDALRKDAEGKRLVKVSDVGQCSMQYEIVAGE